MDMIGHQNIGVQRTPRRQKDIPQLGQEQTTLTQIWVALCVCLLIAFLKFSSRVQLTMQQIARLLQLNLFLRRDLLELLTGETAPPTEPPGQLALGL